MSRRNLSLSFALLAVIGCSDMNMSQLKGVGSLVSDIQNGTPDVNSLGKVDIATSLSAGKDLFKTISLSDEEVNKIAMQAAEHSDRANRVAGTANSYAKRLNRLTSKHRKEDGLNLTFKVYITSDVNAFAMADGNIRVFSGLMDLMPDDDELLAIIGHEIGHVKLGHRKEKMRMAYAASAARKGLASMNNSVGAIANSGVVGGMVEKAVNAQFSQSEEREADDYAVEFLKRHNYDPYGAVEAMKKFAKLAEDSGRDSKAFSFLSSHPGAGRRAERLAAALVEDGVEPVVAAKQTPEKKANAVSGAEDEPEEVIARNLPAENPVISEVSTTPKRVATSQGYEAKTKVATLKVSPKKRNIAHQVQVIDRVEPGYYVQLTAKTEKYEAQEKVESLNIYGISAQTQEAIVRGTTYYRVLVGPYLSKHQAAESKQKIVFRNVTNEVPFIQKFN